VIFGEKPNRERYWLVGGALIILRAMTNLAATIELRLSLFL
jgi:hypothetical protein